MSNVIWFAMYVLLNVLVGLSEPHVRREQIGSFFTISIMSKKPFRKLLKRAEFESIPRPFYSDGKFS